MTHRWFHIAKKDEKRFISRVCSFFAVLMPLTAVPQITLLYGTRNAAGLSLTMWILYTIGCIPFLLFGIIYKHVQLVVLNILWLVMEIIVIAGILMYGSH